MFQTNPILATDSYKESHPYQYPPNTTELLTYIESRGGPTDGMIFFGAQMLAEDLASVTVTTELIDHAENFVNNHIGPGIFHRKGWELIRDKYNGKIALEIRAAREGLYIPNHNVMVTVRSTDPELFWLTSWAETQVLRAIWYPSTVATVSNSIKKVIYQYLLDTSDDADGQINFKLHDFGARGVSSAESAGIGGAAHLVNFMGSDTMEGVQYANHYYNSPMAAFSIPAAEHSTITSWGKEHEVDAYRNMLKTFAKPGSLVAVVSDSYDLFNAIDKLWGDTLKQEVIDSGATIVIRPDSGNPSQIVLQSLIGLEEAFGSTVNSKGYRVLNNVRVIQGDGINIDSIKEILSVATAADYSADNIAFGMGGALLQQPNRDTYKFANKLCLAKIDGKYVNVFKDPVTDPGKRSKSGDLDLVKFGHGLMTIDRLVNHGSIGLNNAPSELQLVYKNGVQYNRTTLDEIRALVNHNLKQSTRVPEAVS